MFLFVKDFSIWIKHICLGEAFVFYVGKIVYLLGGDLGGDLFILGEDIFIVGRIIGEVIYVGKIVFGRFCIW